VIAITTTTTTKVIIITINSDRTIRIIVISQILLNHRQLNKWIILNRIIINKSVNRITTATITRLMFLQRITSSALAIITTTTDMAIKGMMIGMMN